MTEILAQSNPAAGVDTVLYTVPAGKKLSLPVINIASISAVTVTFRVAIVPSGEVLATRHYVYYDCQFLTGDAFRDDELRDMIFEQGDKIYIRASTNELAFHLYGKEDLE